MNKLKKIALLFTVTGILLIAFSAVLQFCTPVGDMHPMFLSGTKSFDNVREIIVSTGALPVAQLTGAADFRL